MGFIDTVRESAARYTSRLGSMRHDSTGDNMTYEMKIEELQESIADMQLAREDAGWTRIIGETEKEFTRDGIQRNADLCRAYALANPLIKRGLNVRAAYVWGQGVGITASETGENGRQDVNKVIQKFLDDPGNRRVFTGHQARLDNESAIGTDGNRFVACFTDQIDGDVQVRIIPFDEVQEILTNPEDSSEAWYYYRAWTEKKIVNGRTATVERKAYYPAIGFHPVVQHRKIDDIEVMWEAPVCHVKDNNLAEWNWGVPDAYAAIPWIKAYKTYLEDWATLMRSLARISWQVKAADRHSAVAARKGLDDAMKAPGAGGGFVGTNAQLEAVPKSGADIDAESGKPLAVMVAAALEIPVTLLTGDPGSTGARAVAETLDRPMILGFESRREVWTEAYRAILNHVIDASATAPGGMLHGHWERRNNTTARVVLDADTERTLNVDWPSLDEMSGQDAVEMVVTAHGSGLIPNETAVRLALRYMGVNDIDEIIDTMRDDEGEVVMPDQQVGDYLVNRYEQGRTV